MRRLFLHSIFLLLLSSVSAQDSFHYTVQLEPVMVNGFPGLHSFAWAQHEGKWLLIGGRLDGVHARQPFNAFPAAMENSNVFVLDIYTKQLWSAPLTTLPAALREQLQSTNINFYQDNDTLYLAGGYGYSPSAGDHITYPFLASVRVSQVIQAVIQGSDIAPYFRQITDPVFAVTGGQMGKIADTFILVGGHRFDGRYNPMGNPSYTQTYTSEIRRFRLHHINGQLSYSGYRADADAVHLRRRDFNLLPQVFPDGSHGYTISSGVFQISANLPYLYPVDIHANGYQPVPTFNQYLSNYHGAKVALHNGNDQSMHTIFFGGISQYYYSNGFMVQDNQVPFVSTISRLSRLADGSLKEYRMASEMPGLRGAGAEFVINEQLPHFPSKVIRLDQVDGDTIELGHIVGGISSPDRNPFASNLANTTAADPVIYKVKLIRAVPTGVVDINGNNPYDFTLTQETPGGNLLLLFNLARSARVDYYITNAKGQLLKKGVWRDLPAGAHTSRVMMDQFIPAQVLFVTLVFENRYFVSKKIWTRN